MATSPWMVVMLLFLCFMSLRIVSGATHPGDASALQSLMNLWKNTPPSWRQSNDPCDGSWDGVKCNSSRVISLKLSSIGLEGTLSGDITQLSELQSLDLSNNKKLSGPIPASISNLQQLTMLILLACSFSGNIPTELGNLTRISFLALNSNQFTGTIPASLGNLHELYWLDLADNQLTGSLPISKGNSPGLDQLLDTRHLHFNKNQLSGSIPANLFSSEMNLLHVLLDNNQFTGTIPDTIGHVQSLELLRLDNNSLSGSVPSNINNLTNIVELNLANNKLTGQIPNLTGMNRLNYVDLSNNTFDSSEVPKWFSKIQSLTLLVIEYGGLTGQVPQELFSFPQLQQVILNNNAINGTLNMGGSISQQLRIVDFENNDISYITLGSNYSHTLKLVGNPICSITPTTNTNFCGPQERHIEPNSTFLAKCGSKTCPQDQNLNPQSCICAYPYTGIIVFRAPLFRDPINSSTFRSLEMSFWEKLGLTPSSVFLQNPFFDYHNYFEVLVQLFPSTGTYFNRSEIQRIGFLLGSQTYKAPKGFGPYTFNAFDYSFSDGGGKAAISTGVIVGAAIGCVVLILGLIGVGIYAFRQKRRVERAMEQSNPFASWAPSNEDSGGAPQLKGARWFSYDDLRKITNNFSETNEIGSGGYGRVYKGMLSGGQMVAIKRAKQGSMQGGPEFKTEIELLSRVHHKNLVGLVGFCFEKEEQMLVYEFATNGTVRDTLSGRTSIQFDWTRRLRVALDSARGLSYLHDHANPPIIHRDIKSTNILLDEHLTAKVADFGLSKLVSDSQKSHVSTQVKGTFGYIDPEYYMTQLLTDKSDVYSFGVVMLELITARQPLQNGEYIVRKVKMAINKSDEEHYGLTNIIDPVIRNMPKLLGFVSFVELAIQCVEESAADRPMMSEVVKKIETILYNNGLNSGSTSASCSATYFGTAKTAHQNPYGESLPRKDSHGVFDYSGESIFSAELQPK